MKLPGRGGIAGAALVVCWLCGCLPPAPVDTAGGESNGSEAVGIVGTVVDREGRSVGGARILLREKTFKAAPDPARSGEGGDTTADAAGAYRMGPAAPGEYILEARYGDSLAAAVAVALPKRDSLYRVDIRLDHGGRVAGRLRDVHDAGGGPGAYVRVVGLERAASVSPEGEFILANLPAGDFELNVVAEHLQAESPVNHLVELAPGESLQTRDLPAFPLWVVRKANFRHTLLPGDTAAFWKEDFPLSLELSLERHSYLEEGAGRRFEFEPVRIGDAMDSLRWTVDGQPRAIRLLSEFTAEFPVEHDDLDSGSLDSVSLEFLTKDGTPSAFQWFIRYRGAQWAGEPFPAYLDSIVPALLAGPDSLVHNVWRFPDAPFLAIQKWHQSQKAAHPEVYGACDPLVYALLARMRLDDRMAVRLHLDSLRKIAPLFFTPDSFDPLFFNNVLYNLARSQMERMEKQTGGRLEMSRPPDLEGALTKRQIDILAFDPMIARIQIIPKDRWLWTLANPYRPLRPLPAPLPKASGDPGERSNP